MEVPLKSAKDRTFARFLRQDKNGAWEVEFLQLAAVAEQPVEQVTLASLRVNPGLKKNVFVSWFNSPGKLFVHWAENQQVIDSLSNELQTLSFRKKS